MSTAYEQSPQWAHITDTLITSDAAADLSDFRSSSINYKMALWDPQTSGVRYLKALTYNLGIELSGENRARLRKIRHREVGNPITVNCGGDTICMDYLQAVYELEFIRRAVNLDNMSVLEIGAGYGRTCHAILSNHDVTSYSIIDLPNSLEISRKYLRAVLDDQQFSKVHFMTTDDAAGLPGSTGYDICININSFAEMTSDTVHNYLALIDARCHYFYTKNPVGKYLDKDLDGHSQGAEVVELALNSGVLRDIIDIHDSDAVWAARPEFVEAYRPCGDWVCLGDGWGRPWSFYWQALYQREQSDDGSGTGGANGVSDSRNGVPPAHFRDLTTSHTVAISTSPADIYRLISDITRHGEWSPVCVGGQWDPGAEARVGAWFTGRNRFNGNEWTTRCQVTAAVPGSEFAFVVGGAERGWVRWAYTLTPVADGTEVTETWTLLRAIPVVGDDRELLLGLREQNHVNLETSLQVIEEIAGQSEPANYA